jgi:hypothetical protein
MRLPDLERGLVRTFEYGCQPKVSVTGRFAKPMVEEPGVRNYECRQPYISNDDEENACNSVRPLSVPPQTGEQQIQLDAREVEGALLSCVQTVFRRQRLQVAVHKLSLVTSLVKTQIRTRKTRLHTLRHGDRRRVEDYHWPSCPERWGDEDKE